MIFLSCVSKIILVRWLGYVSLTDDEEEPMPYKIRMCLVLAIYCMKRYVEFPFHFQTIDFASVKPIVSVSFCILFTIYRVQWWNAIVSTPNKPVRSRDSTESEDWQWPATPVICLHCVWFMSQQNRLHQKQQHLYHQHLNLCNTEILLYKPARRQFFSIR